MSKIVLEVDDKKLPAVLNILENLKEGLIQNISVNAISNKQNDIKPVKSSLDKIETKSSNQIDSNKYLSKAKYKQKLNQKPEEDEFLPKTTSSGKYLSRDDFKNKLKNK